jgi:NAD+ diphosphatase
MIHEIAPEYMDNQFRREELTEDSCMMLFFEGRLLLKQEEGEIRYPLYREVKGKTGRFVYLFSVGEKRYFLAEPLQEEKEYTGFTALTAIQLRDKQPVAEAFAGMTALHLYRWYRSVQFCGCCGTKAEHARDQRMMRCPSCGNMMFPRISPAIIVAVTDGERLLLTKYAGRKTVAYALVAGFVEIGETAEECVQREVLEETGLHITDIQYYGSQPWGFDGNLMLGYTARLQGSHKISLDEEELSTAVWLKPEEIPDIADYSSLTREMIRRFKQGCL